VVTHPGREQLVRAEAQDVQHGRVELVEGAVAACGEYRVVGALATQRPVGELGREGRVPAGDATVGEQPR
jgi:hypothetical protein